ncbi:CHASE3 domain-containing protein [Mycobacterium sp. SMC-4]|uniref:CHASE3 domain-containing protein n=1 Tax=Mycobacterium sp. SMC-4 TaxID=2857059 RepID=UPI0021B3ECA6|nr:CHASE3 domain-containing protein [Mycobacterium sp. SMC-4]UXA19007.1 CHASE3 domain-containing protein [Mycobacterium sp. SMC-4]
MSEDYRLRRISLKQLVGVCLGVMAAAFVAVSVVAALGQVSVTRAVDELSNSVVPIQRDVEALRRAFTDQETGQRGFALTGNTVSLDLYAAGVATSDELLARLRPAMADDPVGQALIDRIDRAAAAWTAEVAEPRTAAEGKGVTVTALQLFDQLRTELRALAAHTDGMGETQFARIQSVERAAITVQAVGAVIVLGAVISAAIMMQRTLTRPVRSLVQEVRAIADGDYDKPVVRPGLRETTEIADAVEQMRLSLRASTDRLIDSELREEQARIAADLHDRIIQRVFGLGLSLTSANRRRNTDLQPFIDETDAIIRDLREVIFNLHQAISPPGRSTRIRSAIIDVVEGSVAGWDYSPTLQFEGPIDETPIQPELHAAILAVVRESLSNVARHSRATIASVTVKVDGGQLHITVRDNGIGVSDDDVMGHGRHNIVARAEQFGGTAHIGQDPAGTGTVVEWVVPLPRHSAHEAVTASWAP